VSGVLIAAALVLSIYYLPTIALLAVLLVVAGLGQHEYYSMVRAAGIPAFRVVGMICGAALITATYLTTRFDGQDINAAYRWEHIVLITSLIVIFVRQFPQKYNDQPIQTIGCTLLGIWYVPYLINFFTRLGFAWGGAVPTGRTTETGRLLIIYLALVVKVTDIGAYFTGRLFGRHKLFPRISPGKTWEGFFGGVLVALVSSCVFWLCVEGRMGILSFTLADAVFLGLFLSCAGVIGDMFESLLKRSAGVKDSSAAIPGMGGILDVIDSLLFGAPLMYAYVVLFMQ
jgi:phosphatidate cytidylyltransferase